MYRMELLQIAELRPGICTRPAAAVVVMAAATPGQRKKREGGKSSSSNPALRGVAQRDDLTPSDVIDDDVDGRMQPNWYSLVKFLNPILKIKLSQKGKQSVVYNCLSVPIPPHASNLHHHRQSLCTLRIHFTLIYVVLFISSPSSSHRPSRR